MQRFVQIWLIVGIIAVLGLSGCSFQPHGTAESHAVLPDTSTTTGLIHGRVTTPGGMPIAEVPVGAQSQGNTVPVPALARLTDQNGQYTWQLPSGTYVIMVGTITKTVDLQAGQIVTLDFVDP